MAKWVFMKCLFVEKTYVHTVHFSFSLQTKMRLQNIHYLSSLGGNIKPIPIYQSKGG